MKFLLLLLIASCNWILLYAQESMPLDSLFYDFKKVREICKKDNEELWGKSLYSPILVINRISKEIVANEKDNQNLLLKKGNVYIGNYPQNSIIAYTATYFAGKSWVMMAYPFEFKDSFQLYCTYIHESFHRIQGDLGFNCKDYDNSHMDKMYARIYLKLEWEALLKGVTTSGNERDIAIKDALLFRQYRRSLFPGADSMECRFEIHEGLADYTAFKLCCNSDEELKRKLIERKALFLEKDDSYVRTFGYYSGFLYAYLLDETQTKWQKKLNCNHDLGLIVQNLYKIDISKDTTNWLIQSKTRYAYDDIYNHELKVKNKKEKILTEYRIKFTQRPVFVIDLINPTFGIGNNLQPLDSLGTVFPYVEISDKWGFMKVTKGGCLYSNRNGKKVAFVTLDGFKYNDRFIQGNGWTLNLNSNWTINKKEENYILTENTSKP